MRRGGILLRCGSDRRVTAALLGRFLPRLGPLATASGPFFWAVELGRTRGDAGRTAPQRRSIRRPRGRAAAPAAESRPAGRPGFRDRRRRSERGRALVAPLVHVERAVDLELDRVQAGRRVAVVLGDEAARIGLVAADHVAAAAQRRFDGLGDDRRRNSCRSGRPARCRRAAARPWRRRSTASNGSRPAPRRRNRGACGEQPAQRAVIGLVEPLDAPQRVVDRNALGVDLLRRRPPAPPCRGRPPPASSGYWRTTAAGLRTCAGRARRARG